MIKRSRRRSPAPTTEPLKLHVVMANRRRWQRRLSWASASACAVSLLLWLLSVPLLVHLGGLVAAFGVGLALPVRTGVDWALQWIGKQGLSYPTAVELSQTAADPYGFHAAVAKRASTLVARLEPPKPQPWWLPLLVTAVVLALLPVGPQTRRGLFTTTPARSADSAAQPAAEPASQQPEAAPPGDDAAPTPRDAATPTPTPASDDPGAAGDAATGDDGAGDASDTAAMNRFLETLRERPPSREPSDTNPFRSAAPSGSGTSDAAQPPTERARPPQGERSGAAGDGAGERSRDEAGQGEPGAGDQAEGDQGESEPGAGEPGQGDQETAQGERQDAQSQGEQEDAGQGLEQGQGESQGEQGQEQSQGEQEDGMSGSGSQAQDEGGQGQGSEGAPGDAGGAPGAGESGEGAGDALGTPDSSADLRLPGSSSDPEQLRGRLNSGPSNVAGTVRLPNTGQTPQALGSDAPAGFSRAEERAITEGRIPVEYQDIIKNYFR